MLKSHLQSLKHFRTRNSNWPAQQPCIPSHCRGVVENLGASLSVIRRSPPVQRCIGAWWMWPHYSGSTAHRRGAGAVLGGRIRASRSAQQQCPCSSPELQASSFAGRPGSGSPKYRAAAPQQRPRCRAGAVSGAGRGGSSPLYRAAALQQRRRHHAGRTAGCCELPAVSGGGQGAAGHCTAPPPRSRVGDAVPRAGVCVSGRRSGCRSPPYRGAAPQLRRRRRSVPQVAASCPLRHICSDGLPAVQSRSVDEASSGRCLRWGWPVYLSPCCGQSSAPLSSCEKSFTRRGFKILLNSISCRMDNITRTGHWLYRIYTARSL